MILDIRTLLILNFVVNLLNAGTMGLFWYQYRRRFDGLFFWTTELALQAGAMALILLRGFIPDFFSIVVSNTLILAGIILLLMGLERFVGIKGPQTHNYLFIGIFVIAFTYYAVIRPDLTMREIIISAMMILLCSQICWLIFHKIPHHLRMITSIVGVVIGGFIAITLFRLFCLLMTPSGSPDLFTSGIYSEITIAVYLILNICLIIVLILVVTRRLLEEVQAQEEKFTKAFHTSPYAILLTKAADGKIFEVNQGFTKLLGYQPEEVIGRTTLDLDIWVREEDRNSMLHTLSTGAEVHGIEFSFRKKSGKEFTCLFSAEKMMIGDDECILSSINDITDRKRIENALRQANRQLNLLSSITRHDINNSLQVILGYLEIVHLKVTDTLVKEMVEKIEVAAMAIRSQIEFTKVYQDLGTHEPQWHLLDPLLRHLPLPVGIQIHSEMQEVEVYADPMLPKVFFNLLDNAIRHGGNVSDIWISPSPHDEDLIIIFEDNGVGIPADEKGLIFERGFGKNTGLGMFLVREILSLTGIRIAETGIYGKGARFEIEVPKGLFRYHKGE